MPPSQTEVSIYLLDRQIDRHILEPGEYVIGTASDAHIRFAAEHLAPRHALLTIRSSEYAIADLGSASGIFVNGERITGKRPIFPSQRVEIAGNTIRLRSLSSGGEEFADVTVCDATVPLPGRGRNAPELPIPEEVRAERKFRIGSVVATGGMGTVLEVRELPTKRDVAMKIMAEDSTATDARRFVLEAQITAGLEHPNIVPVHELGINDEGKPFYTMKLVRGTSLKHVLELLAIGEPKAVRSYPLATLLTIFQKICDAVAFAHSKDILHRDLKPDNIMLGEYGEALLMDWGLAKKIGEQSLDDERRDAPARASVSSDHEDIASTSTRVGTVMGTPQYMPPEQARGEIFRLDQRTDIYSLGAILYQFLVLRPPVSGKPLQELLDDVRASRITPPVAAVGTKRQPHLPGGRVPESLAAVAMKALAHDPAKRYQRVTDLQQEIAFYQGGFATGAEQASAFKLLALFLRRNRTVSIAAAVLLVAGIIFSVNAVWEKQVADEQRDAAESHLYLSNMVQVRRQLEDGRPESALNLLKLYQKKVANRDLRDWEWYYSFAQLNQDRLRITAHSHGALCLAASADGSHLVSGGADGEVAVWLTQGFVPLVRGAAHKGLVLAVAWDPAGDLFATGGDDGWVRIWKNPSPGDKALQLVAERQTPGGKQVRALAWDPSDSTNPRLGIAGLFHEVYGWRVQGGKPDANWETLCRVMQDSAGAASISWAPDGKRMVAGELDSKSSLEIFNLETGQRFSTNAGPGNDVYCVAIDPLGKYVAAGSKHREITIWDLVQPTDAPVFTTPVHRGAIKAISWSPDGGRLATVGDDGTLRTFSPFVNPNDAKKRTPLQFLPSREKLGIKILSGHVGDVNGVLWINSPSATNGDEPSSALFTCGIDETLRAWIPSTEPNRTLPLNCHNWISATQFDPSGERLAVSDFSELKIVDLESSLHFPLCIASGLVHDVRWSPDGRWVASVARSYGRIEVLDALTSERLFVFWFPNAERLAWSHSGRYLAAVGASGIRVWDLHSGKVELSDSQPTGCVAWDVNDERLAAGDRDGSIRVLPSLNSKQWEPWRAAPSTLRESFLSKIELPHQIFDLAFSPDGRYLAYVAQDTSAEILDGRTGRPLQTLRGQSTGIRRLAWLDNSHRVATCGQDGKLLIFNAENGDHVADMDQGTANFEVHSVDWSRDGRKIVTGDYDETVRLWDTTRGHLLDEMEQRQGRLDQSTSAQMWIRIAGDYAELGWVDRARDAFARASAHLSSSAELKQKEADAEASFAGALRVDSRKKAIQPKINLISDCYRIATDTADRIYSTPFLKDPASADEVRDFADHAEDCLSVPGMFAAFRASKYPAESEAAVRAYRELESMPGNTPALGLARRYFSQGNWMVSWFSSPLDPQKDLEAWRAQASTPGAVRMSFIKGIGFPYNHRPPNEMAIHPRMVEKGPKSGPFGMFAWELVELPPGKWRLETRGEGGVCIRVNGKAIAESWAPNSAGVHGGELEQSEKGIVLITVEHYAAGPSAGLEFLLYPAAQTSK